MTSKILKNETGMASIMFAMFIVVVVALIAVGFAVLVRNDQRQTLDKSLSNQATYAAESAINKKQRDLVNGFGNATNDSTCDEDPIVDSELDSQLPGVSITCLTWNKTPSDITFQNVGNRPAVVPIIPANFVINSIEISWTKTGVNTFDPSGSVSQLSLNANMPTLRITMMSQSLSNDVRTVYINPRAVLNSPPPPWPTVSASDSGTIGDSRTCNYNAGAQTVTCTVVIDDLPERPWGNSEGQEGGWISISSLNGTSDLITIKGFTSVNGNGNSIELLNAQAEIDATAKSQDVIKRLKARVSLTENTWRPNFVAFADKLCKNYRVDGINNNIAGPVDITRVCPVDLAP